MLLSRGVLLAAVVLSAGAITQADDWMFDDGPYTRNAKSGQRVEQYEQNKVPTRIPYDKFFSQDGPHPYIPWWYYYDQMGWPGGPMSMDVPYGGATGALPAYGNYGTFGF